MYNMCGIVHTEPHSYDQVHTGDDIYGEAPEVHKATHIHLKSLKFVLVLFSNYFCCPRSRTFLLLEGYIMGLHGDVFPS